jgi:septal ring factor EnvC (AmiA/AmiB activator)
MYTTGMDAMQLAQMRRTLEWQAQETRHVQHDLQTAELALEGEKKKVEELRKKLVDSKRKLDQMNQDVARADQEVRKKMFEERH